MLVFVFIVAVFSCNGPGDESTGVKASTQEEVAGKANQKKDKNKDEKIKDTCTFNYASADDPRPVKKFSKKKRGEEFIIGTEAAPIKARRGKKPPVVSEPLPPVDSAKPTTSNATIYLEFYGEVVSGTMWNVYGDITATHSGLADPEIIDVVNRVTVDFAPYNVTITTDKRVFDRTPIGKRQRVIITEYNEWYGSGAGGVAYRNSFYSTTQESPAFVFSKLYGYNLHKTAEAISHKTGHTIGGRHQVDCVNGTITNGYSYGKTMGNSVDSPTGEWVTGTSSAACATQIDQDLLIAAFGLKPIASNDTPTPTFSGVACITKEQIKETIAWMYKEDVRRIREGYYPYKL